jgi:hypothetical protein
MKYSILANATLAKTQVDSSWLSNLEEWGVTGRVELLEQYQHSYDSLIGGWFLMVKD